MAGIRSSSFVVAGLFLVAGAGAHPAPPDASVRGAPLDIPVIIEGPILKEDVKAQPAVRTVVSGEDAAQIATGAGVRVAVLDGGFDLSHEAIRNASGGGIADPWDALDQDSVVDDLGNGIDDDGDGVKDRNVGHGTFVAGLLRACAADVVIVPVRVLDDEGWTTPAALARGIQYAVDAGADVINLSLVAPEASDELRAALDAAEAAGVVVVTAAGNSPTEPLDCAYLHARSITVGAVDNDLAVTSFSPNGEWIDVFAPGVQLLGPFTGDDYARWSGTSFSCAFASAAAALVREDDSTLDTDAMRTRLAATANAVTGATASGRGSVDLYSAVE